MKKQSGDKISKHSSKQSIFSSQLSRNQQTFQTHSANASTNYSIQNQIYKKNFFDIMTFSLNDFKQKLQESKAIKLYKQFNEMEIKVVKTDFESMKLSLKVGFYQINLIVLKTILKINFDHIQCLGKGQFGQIYKISNQCVGKVIYKKKDQSQEQFTKSIYLQYSIAKICSILEIGPQLFNFYGYDIVFIKNGALFCMEKCVLRSRQFNVQDSKIKYDLNILHTLHICHRDVKPQNIMWSPKYKKYVFIDFGIACFVYEKIGFQTRTSYVGTYNYSSPKMKKLFILRKNDFVDLYYNDLYGLNIVIKEQQERNSKQNKINSRNQDQQFIQQIKLTNNIFNTAFTLYEKNNPLQLLKNILKSKYFIFQQNYAQSITILSNQKYMLFSSIHILYNQIPKQQLNKQKLQLIQKIINQKKKKIMQDKNMAYQFDKLFNNYQIMISDHQNKANLFTLQHILALSDEYLAELINKNNWFYQIFNTLILCPSTQFSSHQRRYKLQTKKMKVINKLFNSLYWDDIQTNFYPAKVRKILLFFQDKVKKWNCLEIIQILIRIYRFMNDYTRMNQLQQYLLSKYDQDSFSGFVKRFYYFLNSQCYQCHCPPKMKLNYLKILHIYSCSLYFKDNDQLQQSLQKQREILLNVLSLFIQILFDFNKKQAIFVPFAVMVKLTNQLQYMKFQNSLRKYIIQIQIFINKLFYNFICYMDQGLFGKKSTHQGLRTIYSNQLTKIEIQKKLINIQNKLTNLHQLYLKRTENYKLDKDIFPPLVKILQYSIQYQQDYQRAKKCVDYLFQIYSHNVGKIDEILWEQLRSLQRYNYQFSYQIIQLYSYYFSKLTPTQVVEQSYRSLLFIIQFQSLLMKQDQEYKNLISCQQNSYKINLIQTRPDQMMFNKYIFKFKIMLHKIINGLQNPKSKYLKSENCSKLQLFEAKFPIVNQRLHSILIKTVQFLLQLFQGNQKQMTKSLDLILKLMKSYLNEERLAYLCLMILTNLFSCTNQKYAYLKNQIKSEILLRIKKNSNSFGDRSQIVHLFIDNYGTFRQVFKIKISQKHFIELQLIIRQIIMFIKKLNCYFQRQADLWYQLFQILTIYIKNCQIQFLVGLITEYYNKGYLRKILLQNSKQFLIFPWFIMVKIKNNIPAIVAKKILIIAAINLCMLPNILKMKIIQNYFGLFYQIFLNNKLSKKWKRKQIITMRNGLIYDQNYQKSFNQIVQNIKQLTLSKYLSNVIKDRLLIKFHCSFICKNFEIISIKSNKY